MTFPNRQWSQIISAAFIIFMVSFALPAANAQISADTDQDGLNDEQETNLYHTDPLTPDTDGDGFLDGDEVAKNYSPRHPKLKLWEADSDNDGLNDSWEIKLGSNPLSKDTDSDGFTDGAEVSNSYSPTSAGQTKVEKKIETDVASFKLRYFFGDTKLEEISVSTARPGYQTPTGQFTILKKLPVHVYGRQGTAIYYPNTKWNMLFETNKFRYYIHGAYWHDDFGKKNVSAGCINVSYADMERLYDWTEVGTKVMVR